MRILFIGENIHTSKGGIVTVMKQLLEDKELKQIIQYFPIFTTGDEFSGLKKLSVWFIAYLKFFYYLPSYQVVHIHHASNLNFWLTSGLVYVAKLAGRKILLHNHGADFRDFYNNSSPYKQKWIKNTVMKADANIVLSRSWLHWYQSIAADAHWILLPNAISVPEKVTVKSISTAEIILVYLARIEERKGFFEMMDSMPSLLEQYPNCQLYIAGQGDTKKVEAFICDNNMEKKVFILGYINTEQKNKLLRKAHLLLLPSYDEGLPMSLLEAMSYAVVPVSTPVGGIPDVVKSEFNGILVLPRSKVSLLNGIKSILDNPGKYGEMSDNAFNTIAKDYNFQVYKEKLIAIYQSMLN